MPSKNLVVKDNGRSVSVYTGMPEGVVRPEAYVSLNAAESKEVRSILGDFRDGYLLTDLRTDGRAVMGRKNTCKKPVRTVVARAAERQAQPQPQAPAKPATRTRKAGPSAAEQREAEARNAKFDLAVAMLQDAGISITAEQIVALSK